MIKLCVKYSRVRFSIPTAMSDLSYLSHLKLIIGSHMDLNIYLEPISWPFPFKLKLSTERWYR